MIKPMFLYHGSANKYLEILVPKAVTIRNIEEGSVVFATPSKARASLFIVPSDDRWTYKCCFNGKYYLLISDKKRYYEIDNGGAIYKLNSDGFLSDEKGKEWVSKISVKPIEKVVFDSGVEAMKKLGVKIIFCDLNFLSKYKNLMKEDKIIEAKAMIELELDSQKSESGLR